MSRSIGKLRLVVMRRKVAIAKIRATLGEIGDFDREINELRPALFPAEEAELDQQLREQDESLGGVKLPEEPAS